MNNVSSYLVTDSWTHILCVAFLYEGEATEVQYGEGLRRHRRRHQLLLIVARDCLVRTLGKANRVEDEC